MPQLVEAQLAAFLRMLKDRTGRSYEALAGRCDVSRSSLHRYCMGTKVPADFGTLHAFARACGATSQEVRDLHRLWSLALTAAAETTAAATTPPAATPPATGDTATGDPTAAGATAAVAATAVAAPAAAAAAVDATVSPAAVAATAAAPSGDPDGTDQPPAEPGNHGSGSAHPTRWWLASSLAAVLILVVTVLVVRSAVGAPGSNTGGGAATASGGTSRTVATNQDNRLLFSAACPSVVAMGEHDLCVLEVQKLLTVAGTRLAVDADFGPETLRRVTAFQVLAGIPANGVVDVVTKRALYAGHVDMTTWTPARVEELIRKEFPEEPDRAVAIGRCQSYLDPLYVLPNTNTTRNWGVFQISDRRLQELGGTPRMAFDPTWNVRAARQLWSRHHDFRDWPSCDQAARSVHPRSTSGA